jgi:hypothetical protein
MRGRFLKPNTLASTIFRRLSECLLPKKKTERGTKRMRREIELSPQAIKDIDAVRGQLSREQYLDRLLKKYKGVLLPHTPNRDCKKNKPK